MSYCIIFLSIQTLKGIFFNLPMSPAFFPSFWLLPAADGCASPPPLPQCTGAQVGVKHEHYCGLCVRTQLTCSHIYTLLWETNSTKWKLFNSNQNDSDNYGRILGPHVKHLMESHFEIVFEFKIKVLLFSYF